MSDVETAQTGAEVAPVENTAQPQEQTQAQAQESTTEQDSQRQDQPRDDKGRWVPQERVNEITRARREAERQRDFYRQQLESAQTQPQQHYQPQSNDRPPSLQDFQTVEDWGAAIADYSARQALTQAEQRFQQRDQQYTQHQLAQQFQQKEAAYAASVPDYMERVEELANSVPMPNELLMAISQSDHGPAIAYHLAQHLDVADRLTRMNPVAAAVEIGRIEARISAPKSKPVTQAPNPTPMVGGGAIAPRDPERLSIEDWMAQRNSQLSKR